ncbi:MFS transporter [soil metagenome]
MWTSIARRVRAPGTMPNARDPGLSASHKWVVLAISLGTTLAPLNSTMIAVALPRIQSDLDVSITQTSWLVTIYLVAMAVGQPIGGRFGDLFGRRSVYLLGLVWFGFASAACAFAPNLTILIIFRTQQALAGALTFPNGAAIVREAVPAGQRGLAFGIVGMTTAIAAAIGPPLGGVLVHAFGWQAIFWANVPIIVIALALNLRHLPRTVVTRTERGPFDKTGTLLFASSLASFILIPTVLHLDRQLLALGSAALSIVLGLAFVLRELRIPAPVVDIRLFSQQIFAAACASIALTNLVMYTTLLALPLYMDRVRGYNEQFVGLTLMSLSAMAAFWGPIGGKITDTRGNWLPAVFGATAFFAGIAMLAGLIGGDLLWPLIVALALMGLGLGIQGAPVQTAALESAPVSRAGSAAGIFSTSRYIGSVIGTTILAIVFVTDPAPGDSAAFSWLFAGLTVVAFAAILVNARIGSRTMNPSAK